MDERTRVFFDITIGVKPAGKIIFELFDDSVPKTVQNFIALCTGSHTSTTNPSKRLHYLNSIFHRVIKGFMAQGGDFENHDGTGGESIYGRTFDDESFLHHHSRRGFLSMANSGPNTNGSQFFIIFQSQKHLDKKHVVFGRVVGGASVLTAIENVPVDEEDKPLTVIKITNCGIYKKEEEGERSTTTAAVNTSSSTTTTGQDVSVSDPSSSVTSDTTTTTQDSTESNTQSNTTNTTDTTTTTTTSTTTTTEAGAEANATASSESTTNTTSTSTNDTSLSSSSEVLDPRRKRLLELRSKMRTSVQSLQKEVVHENQRLTGKAFTRKDTTANTAENGHTDTDGSNTTNTHTNTKTNATGKAAGKGTSSVTIGGQEIDLSVMGTNLLEDEYLEAKKQRKLHNATLNGGYMFTEQSKVDSYERNVSKLVQISNTNTATTDIRSTIASAPLSAALTQDVQKMTEEERNKALAGRRKRTLASEHGTGVNSANDRFNARIARDYDKYTQDIKQALEKGTAE